MSGGSTRAVTSRPTARPNRESQAGRPPGESWSLVLARQIEDEIVARDWPIGEVLGSEDELMERYHVSRRVLREAVRILRSRGVARARPGPGGGLVVTAPSSESLRNAARLYLDHAGV